MANKIIVFFPIYKGKWQIKRKQQTKDRCSRKNNTKSYQTESFFLFQFSVLFMRKIRRKNMENRLKILHTERMSACCVGCTFALFLLKRHCQLPSYNQINRTRMHLLSYFPYTEEKIETERYEEEKCEREREKRVREKEIIMKRGCYC